MEFLFRRLTLARDLLAEDGVILVSINDEQRAKLELLMDEAMPGMRVGSLVWRTRTGGNEGREAFLSDNHEHVLVYAKSGFRFGGTKKSLSIYSNPDNDPRGPWTKGDLTVGVGYLDPRAGKGYYPLVDPETGIHYPCNPDGVWRYASLFASGTGARIKTKFIEDWIAEKQVVFPSDQRVEVWSSMDELLQAIDREDVPRSGRSPNLRRELPDLDYWIGKKVGFGTPRFKRFVKDLKNSTQPLSSWITPKSELGYVGGEDNGIVSGTNEEGAKTVKAIFGSKAFNYAKPVSLIRELVRQSTSPGDVVLDFFAGSATTAQAVMELNAEDGGDRRFIMASSTEATAEAPEKNICRDVTAERIRRLNASNDKKFANLSAEFAYLRCREIEFEDLDQDLTPVGGLGCT
ncbi:site-specific DNA-methyltransferase [Cereibacter changlensis]|uniref:site-specific DNA-methyltransferase n=1 Tax=Cereibacter changlensis TaxID=402884 RepID=UPI0014736A45|nr:site-specific DNA-methyltransferase [Cereibacter changlensis]